MVDSSMVEFWEKRVREALASNKSVRQAIADMPKLWWRDLNERTRKRIANHVERGSTVIDIACGLGDICELLPWGCVYLIGLDFVPSFIEWAKRLHPEHEFMVADCRTWVPKERADWVVSRGAAFLNEATALRIGKQALAMSFDATEEQVWHG